MTTEGGGWTRFHWIRHGDGGGFLERDHFYHPQFRGQRKCKRFICLPLPPVLLVCNCDGVKWYERWCKVI